MTPILGVLALVPSAVMTGSMLCQSRWRRLKAQRELDRIRTRIATDLHDDIGPSLSQIALLAELARRSANGEPEIVELLQQIVGVSRTLASSMSDVVWSIDPGKDTLGEMIQRMRVFAAGVFLPAGIRFHFQAPTAGLELQLGAHLRRQIFLIFKESVHNIVRHSECVEAEIYVAIERRDLVLTVIDHGRGFDSRCPRPGHGLTGMSRRARELNGELRLASSERGTAVTARVPIGNRAVHPETVAAGRRFLHPFVRLSQSESF